LAKSRSHFECNSCGYISAKWLGKCSNCDSWDSFIEVQENISKKISASKSKSQKAIKLNDVQDEKVERISTLDEEFDLVLGGGVVPSSLTLIGGSPGVGKSTLLLKVAGNFSQQGYKTLYVSGEESLPQIKLRSNRLKTNNDNIYLLSEIVLERILGEMHNNQFSFLMIDSIQTIYSEAFTSSPGSVSQVREVTFALMRLAKEKDITIFIIGHITKEGSIAGPRVLEHMVDTVLYFDGNLTRDLRILRGFKNRFGSTNEIAIFQMVQEGLISAKNLTNSFYNKEKKSGSSLCVVIEGSRSIIVEVQALVCDSSLGNPKRSSNGFDNNRLTMLLALLEKKMGLSFHKYDVFINVAGGIKINEPSADLAIIASLLSSLYEREISKDIVFIGEVSLTGDIRDVFNIDLRIKEIKSAGFKKVILSRKIEEKGIKYYEVSKIEQIMKWMK
jgi:DNA repair protein RadA/Sms